MNKVTKYLKISILLIMIGLVLGLFGSGHQDVLADEGDSDAIAVRILPNPNHYSPLDWYYKQGFSGSPQPMTVDGYEAIRDGRTVYVNVANVSGITLYTNIYLISYTQEASPETEKIFEQILDHWSFNNNLTETGTCFDQENTDEVCLVDSDCNGGGFCSSDKATITRDTKRLGQIVNLREKLARYRSQNGHYPRLESGTYLKGKTVSTWPSWSGEFSSELETSIKPDPINKLGYCDPAVYNQETCWDDANKTFAGGESLVLPANSKALIYESLDDGNEYRMCGYMESELYTSLDDYYAFGSCIQDVRGNDAPVIECGTLLGTTGSPFTGYISATDDSVGEIEINITNGLPAGFSQEHLSGENRIRLTSNNPGPGSGSFNVVARDVHGESANKACNWEITAEQFITYPISDQNVLVGQDASFSVYVKHSEQDYQGMSFVLNDDNNSSTNFAECVSQDNLEDGRRKCEFVIPATVLGNSPRTYNISTNFSNHDSDATVQKFKINVYNNPPSMVTPLNCQGAIRVGYDYTVCDVSAVDPDGHSISNYSGIGAPAGLTVNTENGRGKISGTPTEAGEANICLVASDQYGSTGAPACYVLKVNTYCGDGSRQQPNMEGTGGRANDGYEECDGDDGVPSPGDSSITNQYGCDENQCRSLLEGYCGDFEVQAEYGEQCDNSDRACCTTQCSWTTGPYDDVPVNINDGTVENAERLTVDIPNRGIQRITFDASLQDNFPGVAVMFLTDVTKVTDNAATTEYMKAAGIDTVNNFEALANLQNIDVMMGAAGFGNCPDTGYYCYREDPVNLRDSVANASTLRTSIDNYVSLGDFNGLRSGIEIATEEGGRLLSEQPEDHWKYMFILSDGYHGLGAAGESDILNMAQGIKDTGVEIYTISYWPIDGGRANASAAAFLCNLSSDNGNNCYSNNYSYMSDASGSQIQAILDDIVVNIIDAIPQGFMVRVEGPNGAYVDSGDTGGNSATISLDIPNTVMDCGLSGEDCAGNGGSELNLIPFYPGDGYVEISNMTANILNVCQT